MTTHIVCRDCRFEAVVFDMDAERTVDTHEEDTGHTVESEKFDGSQRLVADGGEEGPTTDSGSAPNADQARQNDPLLAAIENADAHDNLIGYMHDGESAADSLERILFALPSFSSLECHECGKTLELKDDDWMAWRLQVEDLEYRRTDLYCGIGCLADSMDAEFEIPVTGGDA